MDMCLVQSQGPGLSLVTPLKFLKLSPSLLDFLRI